MIDFVIGFAFVAMILLPPIVGFAQRSKSHRDRL